MPDVQSPIIPVVGELIRRHPGTISLGQGVVHYGPPQQAIGRIAAFLADPNNHKYRLVQGIPALHEAFATKLRGENGIVPGPDHRLVVTAGANMGFINAIYALTDPGDEIILPLPYFFNHEMAITMANCRPVLVPTDDNYQLDTDALERAVTDKTRAIVTVSPNNPSGAVYSEAVLRRVNDICRRRGIYHISDEAYEYFTYDGVEHFSSARIAGSAEHTISLFSLSKSFGMASWRIGLMLIPRSLFESIRKAQDTVLICPPVVCQEAAIGALEVGVDYCRPYLAGYADVRAHVLGRLAELNDFCTVPRADGAFYFLIRLDTGLDSMQVVERLVREFGVAVIPGTTFGMDRGCYLRIAYGALDKQTVAEGIGRLVLGLNQIVRG